MMEMIFELFQKNNNDFPRISGKCSEINIGKYCVACKGIIYSINETKALENIVLIFNAAYQTDERVGRVRVGDIVKINNFYYYFEPIGWKKIRVKSVRPQHKKIFSPITRIPYILKSNSMNVTVTMHSIIHKIP